MSDNILTEDEFTGRPELVKKRARSIFWQRMAIACVALYMVVSMTLVVITSLQGVRSRQILLDCTTPVGVCYQDNARRTGEVVGNIKMDTKEVVVLAASCAKDPTNNTTLKIEKCVNRQLEKRDGHSPNR